MENMILFNEVAIIDRNSEYRGVPPLQLMENAGKALAEELKSRFNDYKFLFICGTGNNGGDGYVAARYLPKDRSKVFLIKGKKGVRSPVARENLDKIEYGVIQKLDWKRSKGYVIVDGLLGTGISGQVREPYRSLIQRINEEQIPVVSIDVPSGLGSDVAVKPEVTVTFHDIKEGMNKENCGEIIVKDIGVPSKAVRYTGPGELSLYPLPEKSAHKGQNGRLLVIGGGPYTGAPSLAAQAAYRTGADLVHIAVPSRIAPIVAGYDPQFIVHPLKGEILLPAHLEILLELTKKCDAVVLGPGMGKDEDSLELIRRLTENIALPKVIDADALSIVGKSSIAGEAVLTPHKKELTMITGEDNLSTEGVDRLALEKGAAVVLKGKEDYITDGKRSKHNDFGSPTMTVGGTGDTLAGVIGALLAKGLGSFDAARLGTYITSRAGELAFLCSGWGTLPEDIKEQIPRVLDPFEE
ncbi:MAG: NAD(P)H-hydrate dehydratase [Thermoplasmata archaeon]